MRARSTRTLAVLIAVVALSAVGVAQASAHEFIASVAGTLESKQSSLQTFREEFNHPEWECYKATGTATVVKGSQKTIKETVKYGECLYFEQFVMTVTPAEWEFSAEGKVTLLKPFTFTVPKGPLTSECTMRFEPSTGTSKVVYKNLAGGKLSTEYNAEDVKVISSGEPCGSFGEHGPAFAKGVLESTLASGTLTWK